MVACVVIKHFFMYTLYGIELGMQDFANFPQTFSLHDRKTETDWCFGLPPYFAKSFFAV